MFLLCNVTHLRLGLGKLFMLGIHETWTFLTPNQKELKTKIEPAFFLILNLCSFLFLIRWAGRKLDKLHDARSWSDPLSDVPYRKTKSILTRSLMAGGIICYNDQKTAIRHRVNKAIFSPSFHSSNVTCPSITHLHAHLPMTLLAVPRISRDNVLAYIVHWA